MWLRSEEEVDALIEDMISRTKGRYLTQGISFNKTCPRQMGLLKKALMSSVSFSGLGKELLAIRFSEQQNTFAFGGGFSNNQSLEPSKLRDVGNFF